MYKRGYLPERAIMGGGLFSSISKAFKKGYDKLLPATKFLTNDVAKKALGLVPGPLGKVLQLAPMINEKVLQKPILEYNKQFFKGLDKGSQIADKITKQKQGNGLTVPGSGLTMPSSMIQGYGCCSMSKNSRSKLMNLLS